MAMGLVVGVVVVVALGWAWVVYRHKIEARELDMQLHAAILEARRVMSSEELEALREQGIALEEIGRRHAREGSVSPKEAARTTKRAIIQSVYAALEIRKMFGADNDKPSSVLFD